MASFPQSTWCEPGQGQASSSFLKKRTKKTFAIARSFRAKRVATAAPETCKSFLVLFFKKELLLLHLHFRASSAALRRYECGTRWHMLQSADGRHSYKMRVREGSPVCECAWIRHVARDMRLCALICSEVFRLDDDDGHASAITEPIPTDLENSVIQAQKSCPEQAIEIDA